jgi:NAD(P)-dependent dehydrogenase (short-subunit alcohol dehydrogenase family)
MSTGADRDAARTGERADAQPIALVAGGSRGLGLLIARELADRGHRLVVCARDADELQQAAADLEARGARVDTEVCDVSDNAAVTTMVSRVEARLGPLEMLVVVA